MTRSTGTTDTITAIATARGQAALAVLRVSGPDAIPIVDRCFRGASLEQADSHTAKVGYILDSKFQEIDQVVVTLFRSPRSVTGEDVVEISCHGGDFASQLILKSLIAGGARHALPGEFTQRAFLNGKMDLAQAEAVADLIHASSSMAHRVSVQHIQGRYSEQLQQLRSELLELSAYIELELDFSEEDVEFADKSRLEALLTQIDQLLHTLTETYALGTLLRDGVRVVIGGRPNAGKSTLLNALIGRDRAIVSDVPGTTRDEIEAEVELKGIRFRFVDTAGLREASDAIEAEGVRRAHQSIDAADLLLYVFDLSIGLDHEEALWLRQIQQNNEALFVILIANKSDLTEDLSALSEAGAPVVRLSAHRATSEFQELNPLIQMLSDRVSTALQMVDASPVVMNQRHQTHLKKALKAVQGARRTLSSQGSGDTLAIDLRFALQELGQITGEITNEDVLDQIFSRFCIGK